jgi:hypothetical protein
MELHLDVPRIQPSNGVKIRMRRGVLTRYEAGYFRVGSKNAAA